MERIYSHYQKKKASSNEQLVAKDLNQSLIISDICQTIHPPITKDTAPQHAKTHSPPHPSPLPQSSSTAPQPHQ